MTAQELINKVAQLPVISPTAVRLLDLLNHPLVHNEDLVKVLRCDSVLTANFLRVCNSAHSGLRESVSSVDQAVFLLGQQQMFRIILALGVGKTLSRPLPAYAVDAAELWRHSLTTGMITERLALHDPAGRFQAGSAFTAGLLHDIGKLAFDQVLSPEALTDIRARIASGATSRVEAERAVIGADHAEVGARLLARWRLPEVIVEAVAGHHAPVTEPALQLSAVVHLGNCLAHLMGSAPGWDAFAARANEGAAAALGLSAEGIEQIIIEVHGQLEQIEQLMVIE